MAMPTLQTATRSAIDTPGATPTLPAPPSAAAPDRDRIARLIGRRLAPTLLLTALLGSTAIAMAAPARAESAPFSTSPLIDCSAFKGQDRSGPLQNGPEAAVSWSELAVGAWLIVPNVCPQALYFPSGLLLTPGATYEISAQGFWRDGLLPRSGPEGWPGLLLEAVNRIPWKPMVSLSASVGRSERVLLSIGKGRLLTTPAQLGPSDDRRLFLFANDWPWKRFYNNNRDLDATRGGPMRVSIHRLS